MVSDQVPFTSLIGRLFCTILPPFSTTPLPGPFGKAPDSRRNKSDSGDSHRKLKHFFYPNRPSLYSAWAACSIDSFKATNGMRIRGLFQGPVIALN